MNKNKKQKHRFGGDIDWPERKEMIEKVKKGATRASVWFEHTGNPNEKGHILRWIDALKANSSPKQLGRRMRILSFDRQLKPPLILKKKKLKIPDDVDELKRQFAKIYKEREDFEIQVAGYKMMVDFAEEELGIPLRKKLDAK